MENTETFFSEIRNGDIEAVGKMLKANQDLVNTKDQRGSSPLILATYYNQMKIANLLLDHEAKIDTKDSSGNTALMGVCFKGFFELAKLLIESGAKLKLKSDMRNMTALKWAKISGAKDSYKVLKDAIETQKTLRKKRK